MINNGNADGQMEAGGKVDINRVADFLSGFLRCFI